MGFSVPSLLVHRLLAIYAELGFLFLCFSTSYGIHGYDNCSSFIFYCRLFPFRALPQPSDQFAKQSLVNRSRSLGTILIASFASKSYLQLFTEKSNYNA